MTKTNWLFEKPRSDKIFWIKASIEK